MEAAFHMQKGFRIRLHLELLQNYIDYKLKLLVQN